MSSKSKRRVGRPSKFAPEFRRDAVAMVLDERRSTAAAGRRRTIRQTTQPCCAVAGDADLVLVVGPAGTGKTTALRPAQPAVAGLQQAFRSHRW